MAPGSSSGPFGTLTTGNSTVYTDQHWPCCSMVLGHQHDHRWQPKAQMSVWPLVLTQAMDINTDPACNRTSDSDIARYRFLHQFGLDALMAQRCTARNSDLDGPHGSLVLGYLDFLIVFDGKRSHVHQTHNGCNKATDADEAISSNSGLEMAHGSQWKARLSYQLFSHYRCLYRSAYLQGCEHLWLFLLSTPLHVPAHHKITLSVSSSLLFST